MKHGILAIICLMFSTSGSLADDLQRCVWRCLYGPGQGDPASSAYGSCVQQQCVEDSAQGNAAQSGITPSDPSRTWSAGQGGSGVRYAGIDFPGRIGKAGLYYFCNASGASYLELIGDNAPFETYVVTVDSQAFQVRFEQGPRGHLRAPLPHNSSFMTALSGGSAMSIRYLDGAPLATVSLAGSSKALSFARNGC